MAPNGGSVGPGVVFELSAAGNYSVLYNFTGGTDGRTPIGTLAFAPGPGYLFGTTFKGGEDGYGTLFAVKVLTGEEHVLYSFKEGADGSNPESGLLGVVRGNGTYDLFGTTFSGGNFTNECSNGCGTVFHLTVTP